MSPDTPVTVPTDADVRAFIEAVEHPVRRSDALTLLEVFGEATGQPAVMWGSAIVGYGSYHYRYDSGREGDMAATGFSPRKAQTTVYLVDGFEAYAELLARLGPHTLGKSCLYLKKLADVDLDVLRELVGRSYRSVTARS
ncbi:DUF1801 domain-containing protein [Nakamurella silvestris]|nr:DUF1801 domain-containing protein [Nakamurella silvestris]